MLTTVNTHRTMPKQPFCILLAELCGCIHGSEWMSVVVRIAETKSLPASCAAMQWVWVCVCVCHVYVGLLEIGADVDVL